MWMPADPPLARRRIIVSPINKLAVLQAAHAAARPLLGAYNPPKRRLRMKPARISSKLFPADDSVRLITRAVRAPLPTCAWCPLAVDLKNARFLAAGCAPLESGFPRSSRRKSSAPPTGRN